MTKPCSKNSCKKTCCKKNSRTHNYKIPCTKKITYGSDVSVQNKCDATACGNLKVEKNLSVSRDLTVNNDATVNGSLVMTNVPRFPGAVLNTADGNITLNANTAKTIYYIIMANPSPITITFSDDLLGGTTIEFVIWLKFAGGDINIVRETSTAYAAGIANQGGTVGALGGGSTLTISGGNSSVGDRIKVTFAGAIMEAHGISINGSTYTVT